MQIPFHLALLPTLIIASFPVAAADTQDNGEHYTATLPTVTVVGQSDTSVLKGYINYDEAAVTRNGQLIKETPQTVDTLNIQKNKNYGTNDLSSILEGKPASTLPTICAVKAFSCAVFKPTHPIFTATAYAKAGRCAAAPPTSSAWKS